MFRFTIRAFRPCHDVLQTLAGFPRLKALKLDFHYTLADRQTDIPAVPFERFTQLTELRLFGIPSEPYLTGVKTLVSRSHSLKALQVWTQTRTDCPMVDIGELLPANPPSSSLRSLNITVGTKGFSLSSSSPKSLQNLTELRIRGGEGIDLEEFWRAMKKHKIKLKVLEATLTSGLVKYLTSVSGLEVLEIGWKDRYGEEEAEKLADDLFMSVAENHRDTLQRIGRANNTLPSLGPWGITESRIRSLFKCQALRSLELLVYSPSSSEKRKYPVMPLVRPIMADEILSYVDYVLQDKLFELIINEFPTLQKLNLVMTRQFESSFGCGFAAGIYFRGVQEEFLRTIEDAKFHLPSSVGLAVKGQAGPQLEVTAYGREFELVETQTAGIWRFQLVQLNGSARSGYFDCF